MGKKAGDIDRLESECDSLSDSSDLNEDEELIGAALFGNVTLKSRLRKPKPPKVKVKEPAHTIDRYFKKGRNTKYLKGLSNDLGFNIKDALKKPELPDKAKELVGLIDEEKSIEDMLHNDEQDDEKREQMRSKPLRLIKQQLNASFVKDPTNSNYLDALTNKLSNENHSENLYDFYFVVKSGNFGNKNTDKTIDKIGLLVKYGLNVKFDGDELEKVLISLTRETSCSDVKRYFDNNSFKHHQVTVDTCKQFLIGIGCDESIVNGTANGIHLTLDSKRRLPAPSLTALKVYTALAGLTYGVGKNEDKDKYWSTLIFSIKMVIYMMADARLNRSIVGEAFISAHERTDTMTILSELLQKLCQGRLKVLNLVVEISAAILGDYPAIWFRFIDNMTYNIYWNHKFWDQMDLPQCKCLLEFIKETSYNDINRGAIKPFNADYTKLTSINGIMDALRTGLHHLRSSILNGEKLKESRHSPPKNVDLHNYHTNFRAYQTAKLRMIAIERLCFKCINYSYGKKETHRNANQKKLNAMKGYISEIKRHYFVNFRKLVCSDVTDSLVVLSTILARIDAELQPPDAFV